MTRAPRRGAGRHRLLIGGLICGAAVAVGVGSVLLRAQSPAQLLESSREELRDGRAIEAERLAHQCFDDPAVEADAVLLAAQAALRQDAPERALNYLQRLEEEMTPRTRGVHLQRARLLRERLLRLSAAEQAYRCVLQIDPAHRPANEELARLLATCGRRSEAIPFALRVLQADDNDLLVLLARESGLIHDPELLQRCLRAAPDDPLPPFGLAQYAAAQGTTDEAMALLRQSLAVDPQYPPAWAALGEQLAEGSDRSALAQWVAQVPPAARAFAGTWRSLGSFAEQTGQTDAAIRCYWEALRRAPESRHATFRLAQLLARTGEQDAARGLEARLMRLDALNSAYDRAIFSSQQPGLSELLALIHACQDAGRVWEAFAWTRVATEVAPHAHQVQRLRGELAPQTAGLPLQLTAPDHDPARSLDFSAYPLPQTGARELPAPTAGEPPPGRVRFRSEGADIGFDFTYRNGATDPPSLRMYEFTGGGIGVIDADLDDFPDVFCTQGGRSAFPQTLDEAGDQLFRNLAGTRFANVSRPARIADQRFGQGVSIGDVDGDGFADIYVANIGPNQLWRNNGDGTFEPLDVPAGSDHVWTTSCLMADLNGDSLPDLYDVNYLTGGDVFERTCRNPDGSTAMCMPFDFDGATDRLLLSDVAGGFVDATTTAFSSPPDGKGLGIIAWDENGDGRLCVLVANDTTPNSFLTRREGASDFVLDDSGIAAGIGLNSEGKSEGCMGIALGDVNEDGRLDVHVTNFLAESNTLYVSETQPGFFTDHTREAGLHEPTWNLLGFGTQFLDADLDAQLELFVTNGHLQDLRRFGRPYGMPPQLFAFRGGSAGVVPPEALGPYFEREWLGRSVARIDWNRDGREDLLVGHLEDPTMLLTNVSPEPGNSLSLRLHGTASPRDGTGASVRARVGERWQVRQMTAGDGYQASNERQLVFGLGPAGEIDELVVEWPAGTQERFSAVPPGRPLILVEGRGWFFAAPDTAAAPTAGPD
jgi:tetratricopeptide (TPR) repeat protein